MMKRLWYIITWPAMLFTTVFGVWMMIRLWQTSSTLPGWLHVKLLLVFGLVLFHLYCAVLMRAFRRDANRHSARYFRMINEVPALAMVAIVILAVVKPFFSHSSAA